MADVNSLEREQLELDRQKIALDRDKLDWEKQQAAVADQKYAAESDRRAADLRKVLADTEKAELEAADLRIPFKDRPAFRAQKYQMIATAAAIISLLVSFGTIKPALDAYFAEQKATNAINDANAAKAGKAAAVKDADQAKQDAKDATYHLDSLRTQIGPLEDQAEEATKKRIQAEHDLYATKQQVSILTAETKRLEGMKGALEKQVGSLSRAQAYQKLQTSISDSSTRVTQLLATRMRDSLSPDSKPESALKLEDIYQQLQDNVNYVALARSLAQLFIADADTSPTAQPWKFSYAMTDVHSGVNRDDVGGTFSVLTTLSLVPLDQAIAMQRSVADGPGHRYLQISGDITIPLGDSPFLENGRPRSKESFVRIYRRNLAAYIEESQKSFRGPGTAYRRKVLTDDRLWNRVAAIGNPMALAQAIPEISQTEASVIGSEYIFIVSTSEKLARLSNAVYTTTQAIQSGDTKAYADALNRLRPCFLFRKPYGTLSTQPPFRGCYLPSTTLPIERWL